MGMGNIQYPWVLLMGIVPGYGPIPTQINLGKANTHPWVRSIYLGIPSPKWIVTRMGTGYAIYLLIRNSNPRFKVRSPNFGGSEFLTGPYETGPKEGAGHTGLGSFGCRVLGTHGADDLALRCGSRYSKAISSKNIVGNFPKLSRLAPRFKIPKAFEFGSQI